MNPKILVKFSNFIRFGVRSSSFFLLLPPWVRFFRILCAAHSILPFIIPTARCWYLRKVFKLNSEQSTFLWQKHSLLAPSLSSTFCFFVYFYSFWFVLSTRWMRICDRERVERAKREGAGVWVCHCLLVNMTVCVSVSHIRAHKVVVQCQQFSHRRLWSFAVRL